MRVLIQRVKRASVTVDGELVSEIGKGLLVFVGICDNDGKEDIEWLTKKISNIRLFDDENGVMNLSVQESGGEVLAVSQFTLMASTKKGNRPSFTDSAAPDEANRLYEYFCTCLRNEGVSKVETGVFAADMLVKIDNDGPVTIVMDSEVLKKKKG